MTKQNKDNNKERLVWISYCHTGGDNFVNMILDSLKEDKIYSMYDKNDFGHTDITEFEKQMEYYELVILILNDKYLRSLHCMYELFKIIEGVQSEKVKKILCIDNTEKKLCDYEVKIELFKYWKSIVANCMNKVLQGIELSQIEQVLLNNKFYESNLEWILYYTNNVVCFRNTNISKLLDAIKTFFAQKSGVDATLKQSIEKKKKELNDFSLMLNEDNPIYISYSRKDSSDIEQIIEDRLKEERIAICVDKTHLLGGQNIKEFEEKIGKSQYSIMIYSDQYFRSEHCMYEFVQIKEGLKNKGKHKKNNEQRKEIVCIKNGVIGQNEGQRKELNLNDFNYIMELKSHWKKYGISVFCKEYEGIGLTAIENAAKDNFFYKAELFTLNQFFSERKRIDAKEKELLDDLVHILLSWLKFDKVYLIHPNETEYYNIQTIREKIEKKEIERKTQMYCKGMDKKWCDAASIEGLDNLFSKLQPQQ